MHLNQKGTLDILHVVCAEAVIGESLGPNSTRVTSQKPQQNLQHKLPVSARFDQLLSQASWTSAILLMDRR